MKLTTSNIQVGRRNGFGAERRWNKARAGRPGKSGPKPGERRIAPAESRAFRHQAIVVVPSRIKA